MHKLTYLLGAFLCCAWLAGAAEGKPKGKNPKYYMTFRETLEAPGVNTGVKDKVKPLLFEALRQHPEFVLELPDAPQDPAELDKYLKKKGLKGYEINIRLTKLTKEVKPPKPGERHKALSVTVAVSIFGTSYPAKSFAVGGNGESTVEIPVREETPKDVEAAKLDALKDAIQQAVPKTLKTLEVGQMTPTPEKPRKRK